jgi:hypothetical protein
VSRGENNGHDLPAHRRANHLGRTRFRRGWRSCGAPNAAASTSGVIQPGSIAHFWARLYLRRAPSRDHAGTGDVVAFTSSAPSISDTLRATRGRVRAGESEIPHNRKTE